MEKRRLIVLALALAAVGAALAEAGPNTPAGKSEPAPKSGALPPPSPEVEKALQKGLEYLSQCNLGTAGYAGGPINVEANCCALIAFLVNGHGPDDPVHGKKIRKWIDSVIKDQSLMCHGVFLLPLGTLALTQAHGLTQDRALQGKMRAWVEKSVQRILKFQKDNAGGGWSYRLAPDRRDNQWMTFMTGWMAQALWAARRLGIEVPQQSFDQAGKCLFSLFHQAPGGRGQFKYSSKTQTGRRDDGKAVKPWDDKWVKPEPKESLKDSPDRWTRAPAGNAAGALGLACCGLDQSPQADRTVRHLLECTDLHRDFFAQDGHYMEPFGFFYGMQVLLVYQDKYDGKAWRAAMEKTVLSLQNPDGSFYLEKPNRKPADEDKEKKLKASRAPMNTALTVAGLGISKGKVFWLEGLPGRPAGKTP